MALFKHNSKVNCPVGEQSMLEKAAGLYMECFRTCVGDTRADLSCTKKKGILFITNQLFKIYSGNGILECRKPA